MAEFTTEEFFKSGFKLGHDRVEVDIAPKDYKSMLYVSNTPEAWANYTSDIIYEADKRMRAYLEVMKENKEWGKSWKQRRYGFGQLFEIVFQRKYTPSDSHMAAALKKVFAYYSSRMIEKTTINGRMVKRVYVLLAHGTNKLPYSLRLRLELFNELGLEPDKKMMAVPKDDLDYANARNPKTQKNIEMRKEKGREKYRKYIEKRNAEQACQDE